MENNDVPFFGSSEWKQEYEKNLEKLLKNPPHPVNFTYTVDQLKTIYNSFMCFYNFIINFGYKI